MNYGLWKIFLEAHELGSLSKVAALHNSSQPQVSRQLSELESTCGQILFHRTGRGVILTDFGKFLLPQIKDWINFTEKLGLEIQNSSNIIMGKVCIGSIPSTAHPLLTTVSDILHRDFPQIQLSVREGQGVQLEKWLDEGSVDLALLYRFDNEALNGDQYLTEVDTYFVARADDPLVQADTIEFSKIDKNPIVTFCRPNSWVSYLENIARVKNTELNIVFQADSILMQTHLIEEFGYYAILGPQAIQNASKSCHIKASKIISPTIKRFIALSISPNTYLTPATKKVIEIIKYVISSNLVNLSKF